MNRLLAIFFALVAAAAQAREIQMDWAYHSGKPDERASERVPGESFAFLANGSESILSSDPVTIFLLTPQNFAGDLDEQVFVRWWDGSMAHWIMGTWVQNVVLDSGNPDGRFRGLPESGSITLDLWRIEVPSWVTQPGLNFYAIQMKGFSSDESEERFLLKRSFGDFSRTNRLGQIWSASEEFDAQDWSVEILPP